MRTVNPFSIQFRQLSNFLDEAIFRVGVAYFLREYLLSCAENGRSSSLMCRAFLSASNCNRAAWLLGTVSAEGGYFKRNVPFLPNIAERCWWRPKFYDVLDRYSLSFTSFLVGVGLPVTGPASFNHLRRWRQQTGNGVPEWLLEWRTYFLDVIVWGWPYRF